MRTFTRLYALALSFLCAVTAWADVPFTPTTITSEGQFATDTQWYTLGISANKLRISDNADAEVISLGGITTSQDENLWCFVGDETNGFKIYNKQAGPAKALAAPTTMSGSQGGTSYAILKEVDGLESGYTNLWDFKKAVLKSTGDSLTIQGGWFVNEHGYSSYILNNRDSKLAFWSGGYDEGSVITVAPVTMTYIVDLAEENGSFTSTNASGTYAATWSSTKTNPQLTLTAGVNNMSASGTNICIASGSSKSSTYTLSAGINYVITGYSFKYKNASSTTNAVTITVGDQSYDVTNDEQTLTVTGLSNTSAKFILAGDNHAVLLTDFTVTIAVTPNAPDPNKYLLISTGLPNYRIPAIAKAYNGNLIAVADYRFTGSDIGYGRLDLHSRVSKDNGKTWGETVTVVKGSDYSDTSQLMNTGFGDPCIVADRESNRVLLMSCTGNVMFPSGTREKHQGIARFYSEDNGETWSEPTDIAESIYSQFDESKIGSAKSMFIGSGRIFQSSTVKVGQYYRLYCSVLFKDINNVNKNYVLYSDDFGGSWKVLGGVDVAPIPSGADEPKAEELPDGSILCSSRISGGRFYNIFHFTNSATAEGAWGTVATSNSSNNGVVAAGNSCNGEVMVLPVQRKADQKDMFLLLQSVPMGSGRANVGIYYKELETLADFDNAANLSKDWDGSYQVSEMGSAYSTMALQSDNTIAFLYEESTFGYDYTIVYENLSVETITGNLYEYKADVDRQAIVTAGMEAQIETVKNYIGTNVGNIQTSEGEAIDEAAKAYNENPTKANYEAFNNSYLTAKRVELSDEIKYRLRNSNRSEGTLYLVAGESKMTAATLDENDDNQLFTFAASETNPGQWYVYSESQKKYVGQSPAVENEYPLIATADYAYTVSSMLEGLSSLSCVNPTNGTYPAMHLAGDNTRIVPWSSTSAASLWYIEPTEIATAIDNIDALVEEGKPETYYDLSGRRVADPTKKGIYVTDRRRKVLVK